MVREGNKAPSKSLQETREDHIDQDTAARAHAAGCRACGGVLHRADYPRKPRGVAHAVLEERDRRRLSFCCEREGCLR